MEINQSSVPRIYPNTHTNIVGGFCCVYNPLGNSGVTVLNRESNFLYSKIDGKKTLFQIFNLAKRYDPSASYSDISRIFENLLSKELIFFNKPKSVNSFLHRKSIHLGVWFHITNQCNLRCKYCYIYKSQEKMSDKIAETSLRAIIYNASKHGFKKITFKFSGGECLLEIERIPRLITLARNLAEKEKIEIDFVILTNATLISEKIAKILKEENIRVSVSLDGIGKYNDTQRIFPNGMGSFKYVEKGINNLLKSGIRFGVSVTITGKNIENIPQLTKYLLDRRIPFVFNFYRENPYVKEEFEGENGKLISKMKETYQQISLNLPSYSLLNGLLGKVNLGFPHLYHCGMGNSYIVVRHDGKIVSCQMTMDTSIGFIEDLDLIKTIKEGNFVKPKGLTVDKMNPCKTCQWKYNCCGGCPLLTYRQKGDYTVNSPYCTVYKALIPEILKLEAKRLIKYRFNNRTEND